MSRKLKHKILFLEQIPKKKCRYCGSKENLTYDHKQPLILGGTNEPKNIQVLCQECNQMKAGIPHGQLMAIVKWWKKVEEKKLIK